MLVYTVLLSSVFAIISWLLLPYLLRWIGNPIYSNATYLYPWLLLATILNALSLVPHYALYARGHDKPIVYSHIVTLLAFVLSTWTLSTEFSTLAVPMGLVCAFSIMLAWKTIAYWFVCKADPAATPVK